MLPNFLQRTIAKPFRLLMCATVAVALSACGGGGGNASTPVNPGTQVGSVSLSTSATKMPGSGADGTEVTLTVIVKDAGSNAMAGVTVSFNASSGTVSNTKRVTDANGTVTEKLSTKGNTTPRDITITASANGVTSPAQVVTVEPTTSVPPKLLLTSSSGTLASAGAAGADVEIRALVIDQNNVVVPNTSVTFTTDTGTLDASSKLTNAAGIATVNLGTGTDPTNRQITVTATATASGVSSTVTVNVVGTEIALNAPATVNAGAAVDVTAVLTNSLGNPLGDKLLTFKVDPVAPGGAVNPITVKFAGVTKTDSSGKLVLSYAANQAADNNITVSGLGQSTVVRITTVSANFTISAVAPAPITGVITPITTGNTDVCHRVDISNFKDGAPVGGNVTVSSSRGIIYTDAGCTTALGGGTKTLTAGLTTVYVKATSPGVGTLSTTSSVSGSTVQGTLEFVAPLTAGSVIALQATPAVVGANAAPSTSQQSVLRAVVTDRASQGNPVKGAKVAFSIISDPSGGSLSQPSEVITREDGSATVSYIAGATPTAVDGVVIRAQIQSAVTSVAADAKLTVAQRALSISAGTGNTIGTPAGNTTYKVDYAVFVSDAAGNAVPNVTVTGSVRVRTFRKGEMVLKTANGPWIPAYTAVCLNEDVDSDGVYSVLEDTNRNGRLDPVMPINISSSGMTDSTGTTTISMTYPKDRAHWLAVDFTIRGAVSGSEARYVGYTVLPGLAADYANAAVSPPGATSPYGINTVCTDED